MNDFPSTEMPSSLLQVWVFCVNMWASKGTRDKSGLALQGVNLDASMTTWEEVMAVTNYGF